MRFRPRWRPALARAVALEEAYAPARVELAELLVESDPARAEQLFREALELDADLASAHLGLGRCASLSGREDEAVTAYQRAIALEPDYAAAHYELAMLLRIRGQQDRAREHLERYQRGKAQPDRRDPLRRELRGEMNRPLQLKRHVTALWQAGRLDEARRLLEAELEDTSDPDTIHDLLGHTYMRLGLHERAAAMFRRVVAANPGYVEPRSSLAMALESQERLDEAEAVLREALELHPTSGPLLARLAVLLFRAQRTGEALSFFERAVAAQPANADLRRGYAEALTASRRFDDAVVELRAGLALLPERIDWHLELASLLKRIGDSLAAEREWQAALELDPRRVRAYLDLATSASQEGRFELAHRVLRRGLANVPGSPRLKSLLAWLLATSPDARLRDGREAVRLAEEACRAGKANPTSFDALAAAYAEVGRFADAVRAQDRAIDAATKSRRRNLLEGYRQRRELYAAGTPFRQGPR